MNIKPILILLFMVTTFNSIVFSQSVGTVNFNVTTNRTYQNFDPKNIVAIWITDDFDNFIQTLLKRANKRQQYLYTWIASSNENTVNAVTGATLNSHQSYNLTWNCQDINGNTVPDAWYRIRCEYTTRHAQGPLTPNDYLRFYKGQVAIDTTYYDYSSGGQLAYSNITLAYTPEVTGIADNSQNGLISGYKLNQNYPNPFNPSTTISYVVKDANQVVLKIYNMLGKEVKTLVNEFQNANSYMLKFDATNISNGIYYYKLKVGNKFEQTRKMLYLK